MTSSIQKQTSSQVPPNTQPAGESTAVSGAKKKAEVYSHNAFL
ncbi:MAG: hypothetical protein ACFNLE_01080 [Rothia aeria]